MTTIDTRELLLDATFATLADVGLGRLSLEDVAARAGVSRQTVYRHFGNRNALITATVAREEQRLLLLVVTAANRHPDLEGALTAALTTLLDWTANHPLLPRLLGDEPSALLPLLTAHDAPVLTVARPAIEEVLVDRLPPGADSEVAADLLARLMLSYAINQPALPPAQLAARLSRVVVGGLGDRAQ